MLLLHPPMAKACEPPAGIGYLLGALRHNGVKCMAVDMNLEATLSLINQQPSVNDNWTKRAFKNRDRHLEMLRNGHAFTDISRYKRSISDLNHLVELAGRKSGARIGLANYQDNQFLPTSSSDLQQAFKRFEENSFFPYFNERLSTILKENSYDTIGISVNYLSQATTAFALAGWLKNNLSEVKVVLGGGLITSWLRQKNWLNPFLQELDLMVAGPGEAEVLKLSGVICQDTEFAPNYDDFHNNDYFSPGFILPYCTSRGCLWNRCSFCPDKAEQTPYHILSQARIIEELKQLVKRYTPSLIHFLDNALSPETLEALAQEPPGANWYGFTRIHRLLIDKDFCMSLANSGCRMLKLGVESGSQEVLDAMNKGISLSYAKKILENLNDVGIATYVYLLFGTPAEDQLEAQKTVSFIVENSKNISYLNLALFNMPINSEETSLYPISRFSEGDLSLYCDFDHPKGWDRRAVRHFLDHQCKSHPDVQKILKRCPPLFTSNHAPFF